MAYVVELNGVDPSDGTAKTKVFSLGAGYAFTDSTFAPTGLMSWRSPSQKVDVSKDGGVTLSADAGQIVISNLPADIGSAGPWDVLRTWAWHGRRANLYYTADTWANRVLIATGTLQQPVAPLTVNGSVTSTLQFPLRDPRSPLSAPLQPTKFLGNNTGGSGVEGDADLKGKPKPVLYGVASNIPGVLVCKEKAVWQLADKSATVLCAREGGAAFTAGTARGTLASLLATTPTAGTYDTYAGSEGTFVRLCNPTAQYPVTFDAQEGSSGSNRTNLLLRSEDLTSASWTKASCTITGDDIAAPDGLTTADRVTASATADATYFQSYTAGALPGRTFSFSTWLKGGNVSKPIRVQVQSSNGLSLASMTITPSAYLWTRHTVTLLMNGSADTVVNALVGMATADNGNNFYAWGHQLEEAAYTTQYIPTTTAAVTTTGMSGRTHAQIWYRLRTERCDNVAGDITSASLTTTDALDSNEVGFWWADEMTRLDAVNAVLTSLSGYEVMGFDSKWSIAKLVAPSGTTVLDFLTLTPTSTLKTKSRPIAGLTMVRPGFAPDGCPPYRVNVNWGKNHTVMSRSDFVGGVAVQAPRLIDKFGVEFRTETVISTSIWNPTTATGPYPSAPDLTINTGYQPGYDTLGCTHANAEASRLLALYSAMPGQYQLDFIPSASDRILPGDVVSVTYAQMGLSGSPLFRVLQSGWTLDDKGPQATLVVGFQT